MLQSAGYICKILYSVDTEKKKFLNYISIESLLENKGGNVLTFHPDLVIFTPVMESSQSLYAENLNRPVLGIHEYGGKFLFPIENCKNVEFVGSGMEGLGIILESPYKKTYADPKEHLTNLPKIYQTAIYGEDFETFRGENDFFFGYASNPMNLVCFMMGVVHQRLEEVTQKKLSFFFMGGYEFFPGCDKPSNQEAFKQEFYHHYPHLNVKSILVKKIDEKTGKIGSYRILFEKNSKG